MVNAALKLILPACVQVAQAVVIVILEEKDLSLVAISATFTLALLLVGINV